MTDSELLEAVLAGERRAVARAITLVESTRTEHRPRADRLLESLLKARVDSTRIGITGVPGVGKSTFIESLGNYLVDRGRRVAVLSIDPSSAITGGSILGDKTRMEKLSTRREAFIRPSPSAGTLGGVARRTRESMVVLEAAGYDTVIVETVGVGQSETLVAGMTDLFLLLLLPGGGDDLQGIKRGIMELADIVLVNKADDDLREAAGRSVADYQYAMRLLPRRFPSWKVPVMACSARDGSGVAEAWAEVERFVELSRTEGRLESLRNEQRVNWFRQEINDGLVEMIGSRPDLATAMADLEGRVRSRELPAAAAARRLLARLVNQNSTEFA